MSDKIRTYSTRRQRFYRPPRLTIFVALTFADEERFELSTNGLTSHCSAIELFIHCWPGETRTHNSRCKRPVLWSNWVTNQSVWTGIYRIVGIKRIWINPFNLINPSSDNPCATFRFELKTTILCLPLRKTGRWICCRYTKPHSLCCWPEQVRTVNPERIRFLL